MINRDKLEPVFEITADDLVRVVTLQQEVTLQRWNTTGEPVLVVKYDPITGRYYVEWVIPDPEPNWGKLSAIDPATLDEKAVDDQHLGSILTELTAEPGRTYEQLIVGAEFQRLGNYFATVGNAAMSEPFHHAANQLFNAVFLRAGVD